jgi:hypothetical protein
MHFEFGYMWRSSHYVLGWFKSSLRTGWAVTLRACLVRGLEPGME